MEEVVEEVSEKNELSYAPTGIDIESLIDAARGRYKDKKEAALKDDLTTADKIVLSTDPSAYVSSEKLAFWKPLTGIIGAPYGRIIQIAGKPDSGKSTTAMMLMEAAQKSGALVILWDAEKKFSSSRYKNRMGGDPSSVLVVRNKNITEGAKQVIFFLKAAKAQNPTIKVFIVWDSVGASLNTTEDDDETEDYSKQPGQTAKQVSWAIRKFNNNIEKYRDLETGDETVAICCINQVYAKIGFGAKGDQEKGGAELEYLSSIILRMTRTKNLERVRKKQKIKYGIVTKVRVRKNHLFDGEDCLAELELVVGADGIKLAKDVKSTAAETGIVGWDSED